MPQTDKPRRSGGRRRAQTDAANPIRETRYVHLRHPFPPQAVFSDDEIANIHITALRVIEELGMKILLPEARDIFEQAGGASRRGHGVCGPRYSDRCIAIGPCFYSVARSQSEPGSNL